MRQCEAHPCTKILNQNQICIPKSKCIVSNGCRQIVDVEGSVSENMSEVSDSQESSMPSGSTVPSSDIEEVRAITYESFDFEHIRTAT